MTAQIPDVVAYRGTTASIAGIAGTGLFDARALGLPLQVISSACWRGFHCEYAVEDGALQLREVNLGLKPEDVERMADGSAPRPFGRVPQRYTRHIRVLRGNDWVDEDWESSDYLVDGLHEPVAFSGGLLLGTDFIEETYIHLGFHAPYQFGTVHELIFDGGRLTAEHDRSAQMQHQRRFLERRLRLAGADARGELAARLRSVFSLDYWPPR